MLHKTSSLCHYIRSHDVCHHLTHQHITPSLDWRTVTMMCVMVIKCTTLSVPRHQWHLYLYQLVSDIFTCMGWSVTSLPVSAGQWHLTCMGWSVTFLPVSAGQWHIYLYGLVSHGPLLAVHDADFALTLVAVTHPHLTCNTTHFTLTHVAVTHPHLTCNTTHFTLTRVAVTHPHLICNTTHFTLTRVAVTPHL